jgi:ABC-2 type transport system permease protein
MFSSIFSTISIIEDRREGFLLSMMVSPAPRTSLVLGKILGSATLAWVQGMLFLLFAPLAGFHPGWSELLALAAYIFLIAFTLTGFGFTMAWNMESTAGFHAIMNLVLFPMWIVSGAIFPMATAHGWIKWLMWINPMTYCVSLLNGALHVPDATPAVFTSLTITAAFGVLLLLTSGFLAARKSARSEA